MGFTSTFKEFVPYSTLAVMAALSTTDAVVNGRKIKKLKAENLRLILAQQRQTFGQQVLSPGFPLQYTSPPAG